MKIAIVGLGGVGQSLARELRRDPNVSSLVLIDRIASRTRGLAGVRGRVPVTAKQVDAGSRSAVAKAIRDCDVAVNAARPEYNLTIMRAALEAGTDYLDVAATGPRKPRGRPGILEQIGLHGAFRAAGLTALLSMGLDPGMTNVMAREAADQLEAIDAIRIRSGGTLRLSGRAASPKFIPLYAREAFFSDILLRPTVWSGGRLEDREPLSEEEDFPFPSPVGRQRTFLISHEEIKTLPRYLGKPVRKVDFKYAIDPNLALALRSLDKLGLLAENRTIRLDDRKLSFRQALMTFFPEPASLIRRLAGTKCVIVEVDGTAGGVRREFRSYIAMAHEEAIRRAGTSAVYYMTGASAAIAVRLLGERATPGPGVYPPEVLDPRRVFVEWEARNLPIARSERVLAT